MANFIIIILGVLAVLFLACFIIWFIFHPISRDKVLVKFGKEYFWLLFFIMLSSVLIVAKTITIFTKIGDISLPKCLEGFSALVEAFRFCVKMESPKSSDVLLSIAVMIIQIIVFEGLVVAAIVGWTSRRTKRFQKGQVRYSIGDLNRRFVSLWDACDEIDKRYLRYWKRFLCYVKCLKSSVYKNSYAVVIGGNEVAPSVIKNLLKHEDSKKNSLDFAHEEENQYVILQTSSDVEAVRQMLQSYLTEDEYERVIIYSDLRNSYEGLDALHLEDASEIYVLGENTTIDGGETYHDTMNMRCVNLMAKILGNRMGDRKVCKVLFEYQTTFSIFQFSDVTNEVNEAMLFIPFNRYESWARRVMVDNKAWALVDENHKHTKGDVEHIHQVDYTPLDGYEGIKYDDEQRVHFIVVGMSKMGVAMGTQALFQAHYPNYVRDNRLKSRITFIDANAEQEMQFFNGRYATLFELARHRYIDANTCAKSELESDYGWGDPAESSDYKWGHLSSEGKNFMDVEIEFVKGEVESEGVREYLRKVTADKKSKVTIAICLPLTHQSVAAALYMPREVYREVQEVWVYQREAADIIHNLTHSKDNEAHYARLKPFGMLYGEYIDSRTYYLKALLVNGIYAMDDEKLRANLDMGNKNSYVELRRNVKKTGWNDLTVEKKWSNKYFADSMYQKMRSVMGGLSKVASIGGYGNDELYGDENWYITFEQALKYANGLAECEHNRWNVQQLLLGFIPADKVTDEDLKKYVKDKKIIPETKSDLKKKQAELKSPRKKVHYCICDFEHMDVVDPVAKEYDEKLNNAIPMILTHVDGYWKEIWCVIKLKSMMKYHNIWPLVKLKDC